MGKFKDKHNKSKLGLFISKAGGIFPEILKAGKTLVSGNVLGALEQVSNVLTGNTKNKNSALSEDARALLYEFELQKEGFAVEAFKIEAEDRKDARILYSKDSIIQKIFSIVFLLGYGVLSWYLLKIVVSDELPKLAEMMITMIWTGTSTKLSTIIDFLFGGSMKD